MKMVIDIPEPLYNYALGLPNKTTLGSYGVYPMLTDIAFAVKGGQPLPDDAIIIDAKECGDYVLVEKAKYNDLPHHHENIFRFVVINLQVIKVKNNL